MEVSNILVTEGYLQNVKDALQGDKYAQDTSLQSTYHYLRKGQNLSTKGTIRAIRQLVRLLPDGEGRKILNLALKVIENEAKEVIK